MIFIDASFFIAAANEDDQCHEKVSEILPTIIKEEKATSELILSESVTLLGSLYGGKAGLKLFNYIIDNHVIQYADKEMCLDAMETFLKYDGTLSFADSISIEIMRNLEINEIVSFDSDFDKVDGIIRIH
mgnify:CR=1 FL=1